MCVILSIYACNNHTKFELDEKIKLAVNKTAMNVMPNGGHHLQSLKDLAYIASE